MVIAERTLTPLAVRPPTIAEPALALIERTAGLLAALEVAEDLDDVLSLHAEAGALSSLARAARLGLEQQNALAATRVRIQHRAGTLLRQMAREPRPGRAKRPRGKVPLRPQLPRGVLRQYGISGQESSNWQALASLPMDDVARRMDELITAHLEVTASEFYRRGRASLRKRSSRVSASPAELRLRAALTNLVRVRTLTTAAEHALAGRIVRRLREWGVLEPAREDLTVVVAVCLLCGRERQIESARRCQCGGTWVPALR